MDFNYWLARAREHSVVLSVAAVAIASLLLSVLVPARQTRIEVDSQRDVNEVLCLPWLSNSFPVNRDVSIGLSHTGDKSTFTRVNNDSLTIDPMTMLGLGGDNQTRSLLVEGDAARHLATDVSAVTKDGLAKGVGSDYCRAPGQDWWFAGLDTTAGQSASLVLANPDNEDVMVSLTGYTSDGVYVQAEDRRILVGAGSRVSVDLALAYPAQPALAVHAQLSEGRVAAVVQAWSVAGPSARGRTFVAPMDGTFAHAVVAGARDQSYRSELQLLATDDDAVVSVHLATRGGSLLLAAADKLPLEKGKVVSIELASVISDVATALIIESSNPVIGAVRQVVPRKSSMDLEIQSLQAPILRRGSFLVVESGQSHELSLYSEAGADVTVRAYAQGKEQWSTDLTVNPSTTAEVSLPIDKLGACIITIESDAKVWATHWRYTAFGGSAASPVVEESAQLVAGTTLTVSVS